MIVIVTPSHGRENSTSTKQLLADASPRESHVIMIANDGLRNAIFGFFFFGAWNVQEFAMAGEMVKLAMKPPEHHHMTVASCCFELFIFKCVSKRCCFWPTTKIHILRARKAKQQQTRRVNEQNWNRFRSLGNRWEMFRVGLRGERKKPARIRRNDKLRLRRSFSSALGELVTSKTNLWVSVPDFLSQLSFCCLNQHRRIFLMWGFLWSPKIMY